MEKKKPSRKKDRKLVDKMLDYCGIPDDMEGRS